MIVLLVLQIIFLRELYSLVWLNMKMIVLLIGLMIISLIIFYLFTEWVDIFLTYKEKKKVLNS